MENVGFLLFHTNIIIIRLRIVIDSGEYVCVCELLCLEQKKGILFFFELLQI
jgi:hypothetical protein